MTAKVTTPAKLADQEKSWRRPRSPALAIPGASPKRDVPSPNRNTSSSYRQKQLAGTAPPSNLSKSVGSGWSHYKSRSGPGEDKASGRLASPISSSVDKLSHASLADNWRAPNSQSPVSGSHHRKHHGFIASSNASEVARRAFVASEIGSIGSPTTKQLFKAPASASSPQEPTSPPKPLKVSGFQADLASPGLHVKTDLYRKSPPQRHEDWAATPTSSLPSLPNSPVRGGGAAQSTQNFGLQPRNPKSTSIEGPSPLRSALEKRLRPQEGYTTGNSPLSASRQANGDMLPPSSAYHRNSASSRKSSPAGSLDDPHRRQQNRNVPSSLRNQAAIARFRHSVDPPSSPHDFEGLDMSSEYQTSSPASRPVSLSRKNSNSSLSSQNHALQHSRRSSMTSQFSSPSVASLVAARPTQGVYRPPHMRNQGSSNGLKPAVAHYDRIRTSSLRGLLRSPDPPSRPGSVAPSQPRSPVSPSPQLTTPLAEEINHSLEFASRAQAEGESLTSAGRASPTISYFDLSRSRKSSAPPPSVPEEDEDFDAEEKDFDLSHEEILQTKTSLTDSYCFSRRASALSHFQVGNGVPVVDIFQAGDRLGPGMLHDGYPITIAETSTGFVDQQRDVTGTQLEVLDKLGEGSYAVVYLVQEVAGNGQVHAGPKDNPALKASYAKGQPIGGSGGVAADTDADDTLADTTLSGTMLGSEPGTARTLGKEDVYSSTLRAAASQPRKSLASMVAEEDAQRARDAQQARAEADDRGRLLGIDEAHEGRMFALKCLCKRDLSEEMLELQRLEATIHQALPPHANIVTLYRVYETPEWLFLVLEYCRGQDLYFWLEQAHDADGESSKVVEAIAQAHGRPSPPKEDGSDSDSDLDATPGSTPPSPSLLATTSNEGLLSRRRLRLISKMFRQMCDAVQFCHDRGISHRDIKPENFIVEDRRSVEDDQDGDVDDGETDDGTSSVFRLMPKDRSSATRPASANKVKKSRRVSAASVSTTRSTSTSGRTAIAKSADVVVKLTDFGLATADIECQDFDCGSKPYMAYECRNNLTAWYDAQQADVWSLGIVLLNMIFHRSPFREPNMERCESFAAYCYDPIGFLTSSFEGLPTEAAEFISQKILCNVIVADSASGGEDDPGANDDEDQSETSSSFEASSEDHEDGSNRVLVTVRRRVTARELADWAKDLPARFGLRSGDKRKVLTRGYSQDLTSPLVHSRNGSGSSSLPPPTPTSTSASLVASPRHRGGGISGMNDSSSHLLVVHEDDDRGYGDIPLFDVSDADGQEVLSENLSGSGHSGEHSHQARHGDLSRGNLFRQLQRGIAGEDVPSRFSSPRSGNSHRSRRSVNSDSSSALPSPTFPPIPLPSASTPVLAAGTAKGLQSQIKASSQVYHHRMPISTSSPLPPQVVIHRATHEHEGEQQSEPVRADQSHMQLQQDQDDFHVDEDADAGLVDGEPFDAEQPTRQTTHTPPPNSSYNPNNPNSIPGGINAVGNSPASSGLARMLDRGARIA